MARLCDEVTACGMSFHTRGIAAQNAWSPIVEWRVRGTTRAVVDAERSRRLESMSATRSWLARYGGATQRKQRKANEPSFKSIRYGTRSQWSSLSSGVMCSKFPSAKITRAVAFITECSLLRTLPYMRSPAYAELPKSRRVSTSDTIQYNTILYSFIKTTIDKTQLAVRGTM